MDSAFQTCLPLSKIQRDARRARRPHVFRRSSRRSAPWPPPGGSSLAPEPKPQQNSKSRITGIFRRPDPAFSGELSRRTQPVIVLDTRTRRDNPPTGGRESVRRERTPAADARRRSRRPAEHRQDDPQRSRRPATEADRRRRQASPAELAPDLSTGAGQERPRRISFTLRPAPTKRRHKPPGRAQRPQAEPERRMQGRRPAGVETAPGAQERPQETPRSLPRSTRPRRPADDLSPRRSYPRSRRPSNRRQPEPERRRHPAQRT